MTPVDEERVQAATIGFDEAVRQSEARWGVGRLERVVSDATRASWRRGWTAWRDAREAGDAGRLVDVIGKMRVALGVMAAEAERLGVPELDAETWEATMPDGRALIVCRSFEAAHVATAETRRSGRACVVWTVDELARVVAKLDLLDAIKQHFAGAHITASLRLPETYAESWCKSDAYHEMFLGDIDRACVSPVENDGSEVIGA